MITPQEIRHCASEPRQYRVVESVLNAAADRIEGLEKALVEIEACYVDRFNGTVQGLRSGVELHRPCTIARKVLGK